MFEFPLPKNTQACLESSAVASYATPDSVFCGTTKSWCEQLTPFVCRVNKTRQGGNQAAEAASSFRAARAASSFRSAESYPLFLLLWIIAHPHAGSTDVRTSHMHAWVMVKSQPFNPIISSALVEKKGKKRPQQEHFLGNLPQVLSFPPLLAVAGLKFCFTAWNFSFLVLFFCLSYN